MAENFLIFTPNPPSITSLPNSGKQTKWNKLENQLKIILDNYKIDDLTNQEMNLFSFFDEKLEKMEKSHLHKIIKKFADKIKEEMKNNHIKPGPISLKNDISEFNLNFGNILSIVYNIILYILENITSKGKTSEIIYDFIFNEKIPSFKENKGEVKIGKIIKLLDDVKTLNICLYKDPKDNYYNNRKKDKPPKNNSFYMDPKIIFLFGLFYKSFFRKIMSINFDLNIPPIDEYYNDNKNPYLVNEEQILLNGKKYKDIIIGNLILIKTLQKFKFLTNLNFKMYDSYQLELHNTLSILFENNISNEINEFRDRKLTVPKLPMTKLGNDDIKKSKRTNSIFEENPTLTFSPKFNNNYLYFQHLLNSRENSFFDFCFDFNSLDPLLFSSVNYALIKFTCISKLNLILFPHSKFNKRKTALNSYYFSKYLSNYEKSYNYSRDDKKIYYQYLDNADNADKPDQNNFILKDEKLLNELFDLFNKNLQSLSIILEKKITELLTLSIDFSTHNNDSISLCDYDNYNCSIVCFIFDLFKTFQLQTERCKIKSLDILYDDFLDEKSFIVETIKKKNPSWNNGFQLNELQLNHINFNISNISLILPFENFPSVNLTELFVSNLSYNDLNNLINAFKNKKDIFPVLVRLDITLGIFVEDYSQPLEILLKECLPKNLKFFNIKLPLNISMTELIDILYWIILSHNNDLIIKLKIIHEKMSQCIKKEFFGAVVADCFDEVKYYLLKRNLMINYKEIEDNKTIKVKIKKYQEKELNNYYSIIYCLQKYKNELSGDKYRSIYENIFNFKGNFKEYIVNVEVEE